MTWIASWQASAEHAAGREPFDTEADALTYAESLHAKERHPAVVVWEIDGEGAA